MAPHRISSYVWGRVGPEECASLGVVGAAGAHREETEELMRKYEARLYILQQARRDPLVKQISDNQVSKAH